MNNEILLDAGPRIPANKVYMPFVVSHTETVAGSDEKTAEPRVQAVFTLMRGDPRQGRRGMVFDDRVALVALSRCMRRAREGWTGHVDPQGRGANDALLRAGIRLPDSYDNGLDANNCEWLAHGGRGMVASVWLAWMNSVKGHAIGILALDPFFATQRLVGVAYYYDVSSEFKHYWAIMSVPPQSE